MSKTLITVTHLEFDPPTSESFLFRTGAPQHLIDELHVIAEVDRSERYPDDNVFSEHPITDEHDDSNHNLGVIGIFGGSEPLIQEALGKAPFKEVVIGFSQEEALAMMREDPSLRMVPHDRIYNAIHDNTFFFSLGELVGQNRIDPSLMSDASQIFEQENIRWYKEEYALPLVPAYYSHQAGFWGRWIAHTRYSFQQFDERPSTRTSILLWRISTADTNIQNESYFFRTQSGRIFQFENGSWYPTQLSREELESHRWCLIVKEHHETLVSLPEGFDFTADEQPPVVES